MILIRHADAGDPDPGRYPDDGLRPLTPRGQQEHEAIARALHRMGIAATHVLTSPLLRARQTADITARALGHPGVPEPVEALGDRFSTRDLLNHLAQCPADALVVCVGHEPHLSRFAATLLHHEGAVRIALPKSGVIALECPGHPGPGMARLLFALPPEGLVRLLTESGGPGAG